MTNLEKLTARIVELVPEIMPDKDNLKEGDSVIYKDLPGTVVFNINGATRQACMVYFETSPLGNRHVPFEINKGKVSAVLPRTITLCDVIESLHLAESKGQINQDCVSVAIHLYSVYDLIDNLLEEWDRLNNALHLQPQPTIDWLCEVLGIQ